MEEAWVSVPGSWPDQPHVPCRRARQRHARLVGTATMPLAPAPPSWGTGGSGFPGYPALLPRFKGCAPPGSDF